MNAPVIGAVPVLKLAVERHRERFPCAGSARADLVLQRLARCVGDAHRDLLRDGRPRAHEQPRGPGGNRGGAGRHDVGRGFGFRLGEVVGDGERGLAVGGRAERDRALAGVGDEGPGRIRRRKAEVHSAGGRSGGRGPGAAGKRRKHGGADGNGLARLEAGVEREVHRRAGKGEADAPGGVHRVAEERGAAWDEGGGVLRRNHDGVNGRLVGRTAGGRRGPGDELAVAVGVLEESEHVARRLGLQAPDEAVARELRDHRAEGLRRRALGLAVEEREALVSAQFIPAREREAVHEVGEKLPHDMPSLVLEGFLGRAARPSLLALGRGETALRVEERHFRRAVLLEQCAHPRVAGGKVLRRLHAVGVHRPAADA